MNFLNIIFGFFKKAFSKEYLPLTLVVVIAALVFMNFRSCESARNAKNELVRVEKQYNHNLGVAKDSITRVFDDKLKSYISEKDSYVVDKLTEMEKWDKDFYDRLNKVEGKILAAIESSVEGDLGPLELGNELVVIDKKKNKYGLHFRSVSGDSGYSQLLVGTSRFFAVPNEAEHKWSLLPDSTIIDSNQIKINVTYGLREIEDKYNVFAICDSPKIRFTDLTGGVFLDKCNDVSNIKPQKPWVVGPYVGYGVNFGPAMKDPRFGFSAGVSLTYNLLSFGKSRVKK